MTGVTELRELLVEQFFITGNMRVVAIITTPFLHGPVYNFLIKICPRMAFETTLLTTGHSCQHEHHRDQENKYQSNQSHLFALPV